MPTKKKAAQAAAPDVVSEHGSRNPKASPATQRLEAAAQTREKIVAFWRWGIANEPTIHYAQERPMERLHDHAGLQKLPRNCDCSEFFTDGYAFANAPDPNGAGYNGTGYTGTLIAHGIHVIKADAQPGDAVIFGPDPGHHVCGVLIADVNDPVLVSHGQERGPMKILLSEEAKYQPGPVRFFRYLPRA